MSKKIYREGLVLSQLDCSKAKQISLFLISNFVDSNFNFVSLQHSRINFLLKNEMLGETNK